jgi:glycosyltransferase involved in cell wall biosynthesis
VGESTRRYLIQEKGIPRERVLTIPTGVDLTVFDPLKIRENLRNELGISAETPVIGTMAVFRRSKGHRSLLRAMPQILSEITGFFL